MDLFYRFFICKIVLKVFLSPIRSIISSSIICGTTWTTVKTQLQKSTICHAINNVGCMHIFAHPMRFCTVWEIKDLSSIAGIPEGFGSQYSYYVPDFIWPSLEGAIASFGCMGCYEKSLHVMWKCWGWMSPSTLDALQLWCLNSVCLNGNPWPTSYWRIMAS